jgi:hypothetical protein
MGLSNQIPASRLIQPGVCTSTTRPSSPFEGQVIYETDTDLTYMYSGSAWTQVSGSTAVGNSGLVYVTSQTVGSAVSTQVVSSCFNSTYDSYRVVISNVTMSSTASNNYLYAKMHDGTNPASTNYQFALARVDIAASTVSGFNQQNGTGGILIGAGTGDKFGTSFDVINPNIATHTIFPHVSFVNISTGYIASGAGMHQTSTAYTGFQVAPGSGTITGGTIVVYGYRKA